MSLLVHLDLFLTPFVSDPDAAFARAAAVGIKNKGAVEVAAWCFELAARVEDLARGHGLRLALMGGTACQLRLRAEVQRGSKDDDFLTTASREDIARLMDALRAHFAPVSENGIYFSPDPYSPKRSAKVLDMQRYDLRVPSAIGHATQGGVNGQHISLEFHFVEALPPTENMDGRLFPFDSSLSLEIPKIAYQSALKLMTLADPPVGIPDDRQDDIPKHLNDLDQLLVHFASADWASLRDAVDKTAAQEPQIAGHDVLAEVDKRLATWADLGGTDPAARRRAGWIRDQQAMMADRLTITEWSARAHRLRWALRCASIVDGQGYWDRACATASEVAALAGAHSLGAREIIVARWRERRGGGRLPDAAGYKAEIVWWHYLGDIVDLGELPVGWSAVP
jgi:hypothetical protein